MNGGFNSYFDWFKQTHSFEPRSWQERLGDTEVCNNRLIRIPTGMGKTLGILSSWIYHRLIRKDPAWPRRLVWMLPMRVLVEQTLSEAKRLLSDLGLLDDEDGASVFSLMGGEDAGDWRLFPERPAILVGTQDMLLSRCLNRGYGSARARWPMEYALLWQNCLWVMDEVQLMDVGLITSVQLQVFRNQERDAGKLFHPAITWWMSATLQPDWLHTVDAAGMIDEMKKKIHTVLPSEQNTELWKITKSFSMQSIDHDDHKALAKIVFDEHDNSTDLGYGRVTLAICNTVKSAVAVHKELMALQKKSEFNFDLRLIHSRFRGNERQAWAGDFLSKEHCKQGVDRIIVATQVVEAGVDISAGALITELAPWPSLVQRFGRCARYGGTGRAVVVDQRLTSKQCLPYTQEELDAAREALGQLDDVGILSLEDFELKLLNDNSDLLTRLFPYEYLHLLTRRENDELFDTSPDLTGADLDISRFIRSGEERDVSVFWADIPQDTKAPPGSKIRPSRLALCPVPIGDAKTWLFPKTKKPRAWVWNYLDNEWQHLDQNRLYPGQTILVAADVGGYDSELGFTGKSGKKPIELVDTLTGQGDSDLAQGRDDASYSSKWKTIATHGRETAEITSSLLKILGIPEEIRPAILLAARLHDWGKMHPVFVSNIKSDADGPPRREDLAKAPQDAWVSLNQLYGMDKNLGKRRGFRHELASCIACFELLRQNDPNHESLLGPFKAFLDAGVLTSPSKLPASNGLPNPFGDISAEDFDLMAYLICCHHGKVRGSWQSTPQDQDFPSDNPKFHGEGQPLRGLRNGDKLGECELMDGEGQAHRFPSLELHLDLAAVGLSGRFGRSWTDRVQGLLQRFGPFNLAYLETLLRAADARASKLDTSDPLLEKGGEQ